MVERRVQRVFGVFIDWPCVGGCARAAEGYARGILGWPALSSLER